MKICKIRPHHILCINNFIGKGYSDTFSENMANIKKILESDCVEKVVIKEGCDDICNSCPHRIGHECETQEKVTSFDIKALQVLDIHYKACYSWKELCDRFYNEIVVKDRLDDVCGDCFWKSVCEKQIENKKQFN